MNTSMTKRTESQVVLKDADDSMAQPMAVRHQCTMLERGREWAERESERLHAELKELKSRKSRLMATIISNPTNLSRNSRLLKR